MNRSLFFPGTAYVTTPAFALSGTVLTVIGKVKTAANVNPVQTIMGDAAQTGTVGYIWFYRNSYSLGWQYANGSGIVSIGMDNFFTGDNTWVRYAIVCDYSGKTVKFYRNGAWLQTSAMTTPLFPSTNRVRYLGAYHSTHLTKITNGNLGPQRIYTRGLSDAEILADYNGEAVDPTGLQAEWLMTEGSGSTIADTSGNNRNGTITGATWSEEFASVGGITSLEAFGVLSLAALLSPTGIVSQEVLGVLSLSALLSPSGIASLEAFGALSLAALLSPSGIASLEAFGALSLAALLSPSGIASMEAFGLPWIEIMKLLLLKISAADIISLQIADSELIKMEVT